jgi:UDP:flavonoid glycosyltransferase YjiC (YdhE family)
MRIAHGVFGYGRGHATRAAAVLPELETRHEVRIFAGGDA